MNTVQQQIMEDKPILKVSNLGVIDSIIIIFLIIVATGGLYTYSQALGFIVFIISFFILARYGYKIIFYNGYATIFHPLYFWKSRRRTISYGEVKTIKHIPTPFNSTPFIIITMKDNEKIKFDYKWGMNDPLKNLFAIMKKNNVEILQIN